MEKLENLKQKIYENLTENEEVINDTINICFTDIAKSSFRISVILYFNVTDYTQYLKCKDVVNKDIIKILNSEKINLAYDTKTIELKK